MTNYKPFSFLMGISIGKLPDFEYCVGKWLKYDRFGSDSSHPSLGSPWDLGNPWRPLATLGDHAWKWSKWPKLPLSGMSPMVAKVQGNPMVGWDELEPNRSYLSHFPTWYSKSGHFPIEIPIKNEKWPPTPSYGSIILKIVLWAYFTSSHAVLKGLRD